MNKKRYWKNAITELLEIAKRKQEPEQEQEPVVWMSCERSTGFVYFENSGKPEHGWIPLYAVPPKPEPLSDEWIKNNIHFAHQDVSFTELVRAVEKAHGIEE